MTADFDLLSPLWRPGASCPSLSPRQWELLLGQARRAMLLPRLALRLAEQGWLTAAPAEAQVHLNSAHYFVERQGHEVRAELDHIRKAVAPELGPVILLKGAAYALARLDAAKGRVFSDIDILVPRLQLDSVESSLMAAGWISQERDAYNQRYYREWMHEIPPLEHIRRGSVIDLHHTLAPPTSRFNLDPTRLFARAIPVGDSGFWVLGRQDMVLHSALHLYLEGEFDHGLRDLLDLRALLMQFSTESALFWPALLERSRELGLGEPLLHLLLQMQQLFDMELPTDFTSSLRAFCPPGWRHRALQLLLAHNLRPNHPASSTWGNRLCRQLMYIRSHRLRMPARLLLPHLVRKAFRRRFPDRTN